MNEIDDLLTILVSSSQRLKARAAAARALGDIADARVIDELLATLRSESVIATDVQTEIVIALGKLGDVEWPLR